MAREWESDEGNVMGKSALALFINFRVDNEGRKWQTSPQLGVTCVNCRQSRRTSRSWGKCLNTGLFLQGQQFNWVSCLKRVHGAVFPFPGVKIAQWPCLSPWSLSLSAPALLSLSFSDVLRSFFWENPSQESPVEGSNHRGLALKFFVWNLPSTPKAVERPPPSKRFLSLEAPTAIHPISKPFRTNLAGCQSQFSSIATLTSCQAAKETSQKLQDRSPVPPSNPTPTDLKIFVWQEAHRAQACERERERRGNLVRGW